MSDKRLHSNAFSPKMERPEPVFHHRPGLTEIRPDKEATMTADGREYTCPRDSAPAQIAALDEARA